MTNFSTAQHQSASLAQLVERGTSNAEVTGSTPLGGIDILLFLHYVGLACYSSCSMLCLAKLFCDFVAKSREQGQHWHVCRSNAEA
jgi:hypothetical protein